MMNYPRLLSCLLFLGCLKESCSTYNLTPIHATGVSGPGANASAVLECVFVGDIPEGATAVTSWISNTKAVVSFNLSTITNGYDARLIVAEDGSRKMVLIIKPPLYLQNQGSYGCQYTINGIVVQAEAQLKLNQFPEVSVVRNDDSVLEGAETRVATCYANVTKPAPQMWFEDSSGNKVATAHEVETSDCCKMPSDSVYYSSPYCEQLTNSVAYLTKVFQREDDGETYTCVIKHINRTEPFRKVVGAVSVMYRATVDLIDSEGSLVDDVRSLTETDHFSASCVVTGNPKPDIKWIFVPENVTLPSSDVPSNFMVSSDGLTITTTNIQMSNNGTFTCEADNKLFNPASASFTLHISELPTTTPPPTTQAMPSGKNTDVAAPVTIKEPRQAGADAAVIGGVVAVAVFVLIVAVILLLRYFMSHKGEYYTNEMKDTHELGVGEISDEDGDDDGLPRTEADLLGEKKRTEHFL